MSGPGALVLNGLREILCLDVSRPRRAPIEGVIDNVSRQSVALASIRPEAPNKF